MSGPQVTKAGGRRKWIVGATLLGLVALAAIVLPLVLDVERHRGRIEDALRQATGWTAELGRIDLSVLGGLELTVSPVRLAAPDETSSFEAGEIAIVARWGPLFRGRLEIERIELNRPDITLVRSDIERGWVLPLPPAGPSTDEATGPERSPAAPTVKIGRFEVRGGALRIEDRTADPVLSLVIENVDIELQPRTGAIRGSGEFGGAAGRVRWSASPGEALQVEMEDVKTETIGPWLGKDVLHPGGRLDGTLSIDLQHGVHGKLTGRSLHVLAGRRPLPETVLEFALTPAGAGWRAERITLRSAGAEISAGGTLLPLGLKLEMPSTSLETALALTEAVLPLGLDVSPPGSTRLEAQVDLTPDGELSYEARGELSAARFVAAEILPEATDVRATFELTRAGELILRITDGAVGGGPLTGVVRIDSIEPLGTLTFDGKLVGASLGALVGGFVDRAPERLTGPANVRGRIAVDLGAATVDASAITGGLALGADEISLAGWDLEAALRETLREQLGELADVAALLDSDARRALEPDPSVSRILDSMTAEIGFDRLPWDLSTVELRSGGVTLRGQGSFDPLAGAVDLRCTAQFDPELTGRYLRRYPQLRPLMDDQGRLSIPLQLDGPMTSPSVGIELSRLAPRIDEPEDAVKGLIQGLIDRNLSKKD
jgi:hypothetical protein